MTVRRKSLLGGAGLSPRYLAFISYSHADQAWARWLQQKLERYRVPRRLAESRVDGAYFSSVPRRLYPVFMDRDELASSTDLGKAVDEALSQSGFMIVVCSPAAAASRWVNEEIERFTAKGGRERILCLIVDGDPALNSPQCAFPPALLRLDDGSAAPEPLAADVRKNADGRRGALLKIIAGMLQVGVDDLRHRELQRQIRSWIALSSVSALVAIVTIGLAVMALRARDEAQIRRGQAEDLIGFMLGDLRNKLEPIGKLDVLDAVGDQAMAYYAELGDQATPAETLNRAIALRQIGEVRFAQGQFDAALAAFEDSRLQAELLYRMDPANDDHLFEFSQAEFWVGYVQYERGELDLAAQSMERYLARSRELYDRQPDNPDFAMELAYGYSNVGTIERERGNTAVALEHFRRAVEINETLLQAGPDDGYLSFELSDGYSWMGSAHLDLGQLEQSEGAFRASLAIWQALAEKGIDARHAEKAADGALLLAGVCKARGQMDEALRLISEGAAGFERLLQRDPENVRYQRGYYKAQYDLVESGWLNGWSPALTERLQEAEAGFSALVQREPGDVAMVQFLALTLRLEALRDWALDEPEAALTRIEAAQRWIDSQLQQGRVLFRTAKYGAYVGETRGRLLAELGRQADARAAWSETLETWLSGDVDEPTQLALKAQLLHHLDRPAEARQLVARLESMGFRHPEFAHLLHK